MLHNVLVAGSRNNFSQCVLCTNFLALYFMMVFIGENTCGGHLVGSYKLKTYFFVPASCTCSHTCFMQEVSAFQCVSSSIQEQITTLHTLGWSWLHPYWLMVFIHETHVMPSSGQVKTKRHLFSYFVIAGSESCPMCQLLQTLTNYHITYMCLVLVAPIIWHYIDWWCLFMKHMWCHLVAK